MDGNKVDCEWVDICWRKTANCPLKTNSTYHLQTSLCIVFISVKLFKINNRNIVSARQDHLSFHSFDLTGVLSAKHVAKFEITLGMRD